MTIEPNRIGSLCSAYALAMCKFTFSFRCTPVRTKLYKRTKPVLVFVGIFLWLSQFQLLLFGTSRQRQDYRYRSSVLIELPGPSSSVPLVWRVVHPASCQLCRYHSDAAAPSLRIHSATSHNQQDGNGPVQLVPKSGMDNCFEKPMFLRLWKNQVQILGFYFCAVLYRS